MSMFNKLLSIPNYYRNINPSTLSGSCDIIVIKNSKNVLKCTSFHIRFGKKQIFRLKECHITLFVNDVHCPLNLKLGLQGEVLFEKDIEEEVVNKICFESELRIINRYNLDISNQTKKLAGANKNLDNAMERMVLSGDPKAKKMAEHEQMKLKPRTKSKQNSNSSVNSVDDSNANSIASTVQSQNGTDDIKTSNSCSQVEEIASPSCKSESSKTNGIFKDSNTTKSSSVENLKISEPESNNKSIDTKSSRDIRKNSQMKSEYKDKMYFLRYRYREKRLLSLHYQYFDYSESSIKQKTFYNIFKSQEHCEFISNTNKKLYRILTGLIMSNPNQTEKMSCYNTKCCFKKCNNIETENCLGSTLSFSLCLKSKIENGNFLETFENFRSRTLEDLTNLVVKIEGCKTCKITYFMPYDLFTEFFFYVRTLLFSENISRNKKFTSYVHKKLLECYNYTATNKEVHEYGITLSDKQLKKLKLKEGRNTLTFKIDGTSQQLTTDCYLWDEKVRLIVSDIDGTITKSDAWGHVFTMMGIDWTHSGVAELFTRIYRNEYKIIYLSSRPLGQISYTKKYLFNIEQKKFKLPVGPVLLSPNGLFGALYTEIILRNPQEFKIACLTEIQKLFKLNPFFSGFGNRQTDVICYHALGIPRGRMFIIDSKGRLVRNKIDKHNYQTLNMLVENVFPPINNSCYVDNEIEWWMHHGLK